MHKRLATILLLGLLATVTACLDDADRGSGGGGGKGDGAGAQIDGTYHLDTDDVGGTLTLATVDEGRLSFELVVVRKTGGGNFGEAAGEMVRAEAGGFTFAEGDDCTLALADGGDAVALTQRGSCAELGFGAFVDASGTYLRERALALGSYVIDSERIEGAIEITSVDAARIGFYLSVVNKFGGNSMAEVEGAFVADETGRFAFVEGDDCMIALERSGDDLRLTQDGLCIDAGFGAFVDVSGIYRRQAPLATGAYLIDDEKIEGSLEITLAEGDRIGFYLSVVNKFGGNNMAEVEGVFVADETGRFAFVEGDDCRIELQRSGDDLLLSQEGLCIDAGFGAFVDASGRYTPAP